MSQPGRVLKFILGYGGLVVALEVGIASLWLEGRWFESRTTGESLLAFTLDTRAPTAP